MADLQPGQRVALDAEGPGGARSGLPFARGRVVRVGCPVPGEPGLTLVLVRLDYSGAEVQALAGCCRVLEAEQLGLLGGGDGG